MLIIKIGKKISEIGKNREIFCQNREKNREALNFTIIRKFNKIRFIQQKTTS
jgi:hypothetical protein